MMTYNSIGWNSSILTPSFRAKPETKDYEFLPQETCTITVPYGKNRTFVLWTASTWYACERTDWQNCDSNSRVRNTMRHKKSSDINHSADSNRTINNIKWRNYCSTTRHIRKHVGRNFQLVGAIVRFIYVWYVPVFYVLNHTCVWYAYVILSLFYHTIMKCKTYAVTSRQHKIFSKIIECARRAKKLHSLDVYCIDM